MYMYVEKVNSLTNKTGLNKQKLTLIHSLFCYYMYMYIKPLKCDI